MAILNEYNQIIREHFDISDTKTRKCIVALEDADQTQLLAALSSALYDKIVQKVDKIDFGSIPRSRGDITKVEGFDNTLECLNIMRKLVMEYKENPDIVDTVLTAVENIRSRKAVFMKAFALNVEFPIVLYNLMVMCIEQSVSFLIATCIQYVKDPASQDLYSALDKVAYNNSRDNLLYEQLITFNKSCITKEIDEVLTQFNKNIVRESCNEDTTIVIKVCNGEEGHGHHGKHDHDKHHDSPFLTDHDDDKHDCEKPVAVNGSGEIVPETDGETVEEAIAPETVIKAAKQVVTLPFKVVGFTLKTIMCVIRSIIPMMRNMVYFVYSSKAKLSDYLAIQSQFLEANAAKLQYSTDSNMDDNKKKKVIEKQLKWAEKLRNWSNKLSIDNKQATKDTKKMVDEDNKQKKIDDIKDLPPNIDNGGMF